MPDLMGAMISMLIWHYLQGVVALIGLGFVFMAFQGVQERDIWLVMGAAGCAYAVFYAAGQM